jgi:hypothetical protein
MPSRLPQFALPSAAANRLPAFQVMAKPMGPICNLDCKYCFYLEKEKLYPGQSLWAMPDKVREATSWNWSTARSSSNSGETNKHGCHANAGNANFYSRATANVQNIVSHERRTVSQG